MSEPRPPMSFTCTICGKHINLGTCVAINNRPVHPEPCFAAALRECAHARGEITVWLEPSMTPELAYKLGKTYVATVVAARRKAKKK